MTTVLIIDSCKPSLVMTSEVFKDKVPGTVVDVATNGKDALEYLVAKRPDLCVVDFDLPDVDGPGLVEAMRKVYDGPILLTAYPSDIVKQAIEETLFAFNDASGWIPKPVNSTNLAEKIDRFLLAKHRLERRFSAGFITQLVAKAAGRGKRAPKVAGKVLNLSLGGACVKIQGPLKVKKAQELTMSILLPTGEDPDSHPTKTKLNEATTEAKIKATVAWINAKGEVGLQFAKLSELQKKQLETYFRTHATELIRDTKPPTLSASA